MAEQLTHLVGSQLLSWNNQDNAQSIQQRVATRILDIYRIDTSTVNLTPHKELHEEEGLITARQLAELTDKYRCAGH